MRRLAHRRSGEPWRAWPGVSEPLGGEWDARPSTRGHPGHAQAGLERGSAVMS